MSRRAQAWYAKTFGAEMVKHGKEMVADIPGSSILFEQAKHTCGSEARPPSTALARQVGGGLDAFVKKLEDAGIKLDSPYRGKNAALKNAGFAAFQDSLRL